MRKRIAIKLMLLMVVLTFACSKDDSNLGGCSMACGGFQFSQPFSFREIKFISQQGCQEELNDANSTCRAVWCPPTGNDEDCIDLVRGQ